MSLKLEEIKNLIKEAMPDAEITIIDSMMLIFNGRIVVCL